MYPPVDIICSRRKFLSSGTTHIGSVDIWQAILKKIASRTIASAKEHTENQFREKRYICLTLRLSFPFQENLITSFHLFTNVETLHQD